MSNITICRCYGCRKLMEFSLMKKIKEAVSEDDGIIYKSRYVCPDCFVHLSQWKELKQKEVKEQNQIKERIKKYQEGRK